MCQYQPTPEASTQDRFQVLLATSAAWHEVQRVRQFLEAKGMTEAADAIQADYQEWRRERFERKAKK